MEVETLTSAAFPDTSLVVDEPSSMHTNSSIDEPQFVEVADTANTGEDASASSVRRDGTAAHGESDSDDDPFLTSFQQAIKNNSDIFDSDGSVILLPFLGVCVD
jgi:hypothetical protein